VHQLARLRRRDLPPVQVFFGLVGFFRRPPYRPIPDCLDFQKVAVVAIFKMGRCYGPEKAWLADSIVAALESSLGR